MLNIKEDYHIHCNYNDHSSNDLSVENVIEKAKDLHLQTIAFTEHVRSNSDWTEKYLREINSFEDRTTIKILKGFEAKILPDGSIDCPEIYLNDEYFIIASFHTKYQEKEKWYNALLGAIRNKNVNVIGHLAPDAGISLTNLEIKRLGEEILSNNKIVEINAKYKRPPLELLKVFKDLDIQFHLGSDAHSLDDIGNFERINELINFIEQRGE
ncbi:MAG: PHP domain-containing protein [Candidatus Nitrosocosmicus sp.]